MPFRPKDGSVAIVHDYLNQRGGAERVVLAMARIWPDAPIYTSLYRPDSTFEGFKNSDIHTSWVDHLPFDRRFRALLPLYPSAFSQLGRLDHDVVISSSSGWAHAIETGPDTTHIVYCHAPARWLYSPDDYFHQQKRRRGLDRMLAPLRLWDQHAAHRPDRYVANARNTAARIKAVYDIDADVIYPPVDTERFRPTPRGERLLVVSRLLRYKRIDLAVEAATKLGMPLDVVGSGPDRERLESLAGPSVTFHGRLPDEEVTEMMEACNAFIFPGEEDFGIAPVEANAAGKPVVAFAAGGAMETMEEGYTASMFAHQDVDDVAAAIQRIQNLSTPPERIARMAARYSIESFERRMLNVIDQTRRETVASERFERGSRLVAAA